MGCSEKHVTFAITWVVYASSYLLRKPLGVIKSDLQTNYNLTNSQLGWLDTSFHLPYALFQITLGNLGDKYGATRVITTSMIVNSASMLSFGFWRSPLIFGILLFLNGASQALLWPNCTKSLSDSYGCAKVATIFGIWGTCIFVGGIAGTALAVQLQKIYSPDLKMVFVVPSLIVLLVGIIVRMFLKTPQKVDSDADTLDSQQEDTKVGFFTVWRFQYVPELSFTMFGMKLVRYFLNMWLPMYLHQQLDYHQDMAGYMSTAFEIGAVMGSACMGFIIDSILCGKTRWGVCLALFVSACSLVAFQLTSTWGPIPNFIFLATAGAFSSGPDSLVAGALASEVGEKENARSAVSGVVNGFGSLGTIVEGPIIAFVVTRFGWKGSFYTIIVLTMVSVFAMGKAAVTHDRESKHHEYANENCEKNEMQCTDLQHYHQTKIITLKDHFLT